MHASDEDSVPNHSWPELAYYRRHFIIQGLSPVDRASNNAERAIITTLVLKKHYPIQDLVLDLIKAGRKDIVVDIINERDKGSRRSPTDPVVNESVYGLNQLRKIPTQSECGSEAVEKLTPNSDSQSRPYMIVQSQSGTKEKEALVLSMLGRVDSTKNFTQVLCLSPISELALQKWQVAEKMGKNFPEVKIGYAVRGEKVTNHIVFGTPGTSLDWILECRRHAFDPGRVKMLVVDEANMMMAFQGLQDQAIRILKMVSRDCQIVLSYGTYTEGVQRFAKESLGNIKQFYVVCRDEEEKFKALGNIYGVLSMGQCIVFCNTFKVASWLAEKMKAGDRHAVALLSGKMLLKQTNDALNRFRDGKEKLLIITGVTNLYTRDIDVKQVTVVVNYDMPVEPAGEADYETYLHQIGRTGRFGKRGIVVNFVDSQLSMGIMKKIEEHFGKKITFLDTNDFDELDKLT